MDNKLLGGLSPNAFLRRYWQKSPLLVRGAFPNFDDIVDLKKMMSLACRDDCESRLVTHRAGRWQVRHGPFERRQLQSLPLRGWTLLVQGVEKHLPAARRLLDHFRFIPDARLDDLMISYAPPGAGVGPHFDSYDVFLLQGRGTRRWQVSRQTDLALLDNSPLKILRRFDPAGECVLHTGDMLYLPPQVAHGGVALRSCQTYSIGFRAPSHTELVSNFLSFLEDRVSAEGRYEDPDLRSQEFPAAISAAMVSRVGKMLASLQWQRSTIVEFLGCSLTQLRPPFTLTGPARPLSETDFLRRARAHGVLLATGSQMLHHSHRVFLNGTMTDVSGESLSSLRQLANTRRLMARQIPRGGQTPALLYRWYRDGYILIARFLTQE
ncbi:MAG: JmjC domain-containing protein [Burkholderiales bacterium]